MAENVLSDDALKQLQSADILSGHHRRENNIELHISQDYLKMMGENPWFVPMGDIKTSSMCVLCLRWFLGMQCRRRTYNIGLDKLKGHIGMRIQDRTMAIRTLQRAVEQIPWLKMSDGSSLCFTISSRPPSPVRSLRVILEDSLDQGK